MIEVMLEFIAIYKYRVFFGNVNIDINYLYNIELLNYFNFR